MTSDRPVRTAVVPRPQRPPPFRLSSRLRPRLRLRPRAPPTRGRAPPPLSPSTPPQPRPMPTRCRCPLSAVCYSSLCVVALRIPHRCVVSLRVLIVVSCHYEARHPHAPHFCFAPMLRRHTTQMRAVALFAPPLYLFIYLFILFIFVYLFIPNCFRRAAPRLLRCRRDISGYAPLSLPDCLSVCAVLLFSFRCRVLSCAVVCCRVVCCGVLTCADVC